MRQFESFGLINFSDPGNFSHQGPHIANEPAEPLGISG
jgi:hypothetical protein